MTKSQLNKISWWRVNFGKEESRKLSWAIEHEHISMGPLTEQLEGQLAKILKVPYCVVTTSGSVAIYMALKVMGLGAGDEVIVPNRTWIATAHAVLMTGARPVLVDVQEDIPVMDVGDVKRKITSRTKAILPVHLNGRSVDMDSIKALARKYNIFVIEDAAQAFLSCNKKGFLGTQSDIGCFSMGMGKLISTGQGGFVVTHRQDLYERLKYFRNHGVVDNFTDRWNQFGFNFKFTDLLAAVGLVQLKKAHERVKHLKAIHQQYTRAFHGMAFIKPIAHKLSDGEVPLYVEMLVENRAALIEYCTRHKIQVRPVPPNLDISNYIANDGKYPHAAFFAKQGIYLPSGPDQNSENIDRVIEVVRNFKI
jgi:dTDP-4-amino-4,6-dideoxygalactose transaminase